jgi:hypothetical protein
MVGSTTPSSTAWRGHPEVSAKFDAEAWYEASGDESDLIYEAEYDAFNTELSLDRDPLKG